MPGGPPAGYAEVPAPTGPPPGYAEIPAPIAASPATGGVPNAGAAPQTTPAPTMAQVDQPPVTGFKATAKQMLEGGAHFIHDLIDSDLNPVAVITQHTNDIPVKVTSQQLLDRYLKQPLEAEGQKATELRQVASQRERQGLPATAEKISAAGHDLASYLPFIGPIASQAGEQFGADDVTGGALSLMNALVGARGAGGARGAIGEGGATVGDVAKGSSRSQILESSHAMLNKSAADALTTLGKHETLVGWKIGQLTSEISDADLADSASKQSRLGSISLAKAYEEMGKAQDKFLEAGGKMPKINAAAQMFQQNPAKVTWGAGKAFRTQIGNLIYHGDPSPQEAAILQTARQNLTEQLAARSKDLGKADQFGAYNKLNAVLERYKSDSGILGKLTNAKNGYEFFKELRKPSNAPELTALNKDFGEFGLTDNFFKDLAASHKATFKLANQAATGAGEGIMGRTKALITHPIKAGVPTAIALAVTPGAMRYVAGMIAAVKSAEIADQIDAAAEMRRQGGPPAVEGKFGSAADVGKEDFQKSLMNSLKLPYQPPPIGTGPLSQ